MCSSRKSAEAAASVRRNNTVSLPLGKLSCILEAFVYTVNVSRRTVADSIALGAAAPYELSTGCKDILDAVGAEERSRASYGRREDNTVIGPFTLCVAAVGANLNHITGLGGKAGQHVRVGRSGNQVLCVVVDHELPCIFNIKVS